MTSDRSSSRRKIEREFGVPIPGEILEPSLWANTALKRLPEGVIDWELVFGRRAPVMVEIGCGNARPLLGSAVWRPAFDHLGVDILPLVIRYATRRANQRGLHNARFAVCGGRELLAAHVTPQSISELHCYHPQPYYEPHEIPKRLITPEFLVLAHRALQPDGLLVLQTDHPAYWRYILDVAPVFFEFAEHPERWPDAPKGRTRREIIALRTGLPVFRGTGRPRGDLPEDLFEMAKRLPLPVFNADRSLQELDALESSER